MRRGKLPLAGQVAPAVLLLLSACDSGTPGGGPVPAATQTSNALASQYDVPATFTALSVAASAYPSPVTVEDMKAPPGLDPCLYLTADDLKTVLGRVFEQTPHSPDNPNASCTYAGDANYVTLTMYTLDSPAKVAQLGSQDVDFVQRYPDRGEYLPGIGDSARLARLFPGGTSPDQPVDVTAQTGWYMTVTRGLDYLTVKWITDGVDDREKMLDLTRKVVSRLK